MSRVFPHMHVLPARDSHGEVVIVGDRQALAKLAHTINRAIVGGEAATGTLYCRDGEGFQVVVVEASPKQIEEEAPLHYAAEMAFPDPWPQWLLEACRRAQ